MTARRPLSSSLPVSGPSIVRSAGPAPETFTELGVPAVLVETLAASGITRPFPIQAATLPDSLAGRDVLGRGRTGSGKTYAFLLPMLARLSTSGTKRRPNRPRALILAPTRELVTQIDAALRPLASGMGLRTLTVFGGVRPNPQIQALRNGVDVVIACPGRIYDHVQSGHADLSAVEITVLDEADHMADLGFLPVVRRLLDKTPAHGQRLLFSATLDKAVDVVVKRYLTDPVVHSVDSAQSPVQSMTHHVLHVQADSRLTVLADLAAAPGRTMVFTRTKHGAKALTRRLIAMGVPAVELHGNLSQNARTRNLEAFSSGAARTLVATDIAARGIHVDDVSLVIHADPPVEHKAYLHRSGRTARAGATGSVVTLMLDAQVADVRALTRQAGIKPIITRVQQGHPMLTEIAPGERIYVGPTSQPEAGRPTNRPAGGRSGRRSAGQGGRSADRGGQGGRARSESRGRSRGAGQGQPAGRTEGQGQGQPRGRSGESRTRAGRPTTGSRPHSAADFSTRSRGR